MHVRRSGEAVSRDARFGYAGALLITAALALMALQLGCGASARQTALKGAYTTVAAAQAGFVAWDDLHQQGIVESATSLEDGTEKLKRYRASREPVLHALIAAYALLGAASMDTGVSLPAVLQAVDAVQKAIARVRGGP